MTDNISPRMLMLFEKALDVNILPKEFKPFILRDIDHIAGAAFDGDIIPKALRMMINLLSADSSYAGYWGADVSHWIVHIGDDIDAPSADEAHVILPVDHPIMVRFLNQLRMEML